ncbi:hypothetical protein ACF064_01575 [Streptomyces sp. NPDC015492]|uniref:hypothetical protein n=1 Tax=Streptomyces sp. NPDC015492 TaxID=3364958 RepID=UPI0036FC0A1D
MKGEMVTTETPEAAWLKGKHEWLRTHRERIAGAFVTVHPTPGRTDPAADVGLRIQVDIQVHRDREPCMVFPPVTMPLAEAMRFVAGTLLGVMRALDGKPVHTLWADDHFREGEFVAWEVAFHTEYEKATGTRNTSAQAARSAERALKQGLVLIPSDAADEVFESIYRRKRLA